MTYLSFNKSNDSAFNITDLVKKLNINRGTFYLHFENLQSVRACIEAKLSESFKPIEQDFRLSEIDKSPEIILDKLNEILLADIEFYHLLAASNMRNKFIDQMRRSLLNSISNNFQVMKYVMNYEHFKLVVEYIVGGIISTYLQWFKGNLNSNLSDLTTYLGKMIRLGLKGCIQYGN